MFCTFGIESKAANSYEVPYQEPTTSDRQGYVVIEFQNNSTGKKSIHTWYWSIARTVDYDEGGESEPFMMLEFNGDVVKFTVSSVYNKGFFQLSIYDDSYKTYPMISSNFSSSYVYQYDYSSRANSTITGFLYAGNVSQVTSSNWANTPPQVIWGDIPSYSGIEGELNEGNQLQEEGNQLQEEGNKLQEEGNQLQEEANQIAEEQKEQEKNFFDNFFGNLIDAIIGVFVPSSEELSELFDRLNQFFSDTFGFLYYPFDFIIRAFDVFLNSDSSTGITFPGFSIMGYEVWGDYSYNIADEGIAGDIFSYVRIGTGAILGMFLVNYLRTFFDKRFGGGGN